MLIKKEHRRFIQNVKAIPVEFQHALVIAGIDDRKILKVERKACALRRKITLLKDVMIRIRFEEKVIKLVNNNNGYFYVLFLQRAHSPFINKKHFQK